MTHDFLCYLHAEIFFTYGFLWRCSDGGVEPKVFSEGLTEAPGDWKSPYIHERIIGEIGDDPTDRLWIGSYQPSFVPKRRCLEWSRDLGGDLYILSPLRRGVKFSEKHHSSFSSTDQVSVQTRGAATVRLFENGSGIVTLRIQPSLRSLESARSRFEALHRTLRLSPNMDLVPEDHAEAHKLAAALLPICDSFLFVPGVGACRLFQVMAWLRGQALAVVPDEVRRSGDGSFLVDERSLAYGESCNTAEQGLSSVSRYEVGSFQENQAPFTFVVCVVDEDSLGRVRRGGLGIAKELGSVYARLTLDNRYITRDFSFLSEEYLVRALGYDRSTGRLPNLGHDERLFYSLCARGAIAVTASVAAIPNIFVVPSILNLFEIIRARLASGVQVGLQLAQIAESLSELDIGSEGPHTSEEQFAYLRRLVVQNQQSPLEYLFDGGTVTELALAAEKALFSNRVWKNVLDSFESVDRLRSAWLNKRFRVRYGH